MTHHQVSGSKDAASNPPETRATSIRTSTRRTYRGGAHAVPAPVGAGSGGTVPDTERIRVPSVRGAHDRLS
ncbi:hypothetical protein GCM10009562_10990 [Nocardioides aquaticus]